MWSKKTLALLLAVFFAAAAALALSLRSGLSLGFAIPLIEGQGSEFLNRRITLTKAPQLQWKDGLHVALGGVALANAEWAGKDPMLTLETLEAQIELGSLFSEQIIVNQLDIRGLNLRLHRNSDGRSNIPMLDGGKKERTAEPRAPGPLPVLLENTTIRDMRIQHSNEKTGKILDLVVHSLAQDVPNANRLRLKGDGSLQGHPWDLSLNGSDLMSLSTGLNMSADFSGALGDLQLRGDYQLPDLSRLNNLSLNVELSGPMPPRIAELSPILEAEESTDIRLRIRDVTPGLELSFRAELPHLVAHTSGTIDDPLGANGVDLDVTLDADSLPRLAQHLELGLVKEVPVSLKGRLLRKNNRVEFRDGVLDAGNNHLEANVLLPDFPGTNGASVLLSATGPDFSFYQKLLEKKPSLDHPYSVTIAIDDNATGGERIDGRLTVGEHQLQLSGVLDSFPSYAGSALQLTFSSPRLQDLASAAGLKIPDTDIDVSSQIAISDDAVIAIQSANIAAYAATAQISGRLNSYPDFDNIDLRLSADAASLADLGERFGLEGLGEVPVLLTTNLTGRPDNLVLSSPSLSAEGFGLHGVSGTLSFQNGTLSSDLLLAGKLSEPRALLGAYAPDYLPTGSYHFELSPTLSPELFALALEDLSGPGLSGSARLELSRDFTLDENTLLQSNLRFEDLAALLPPVKGYQPVAHALTLNAVTRPAKDATRINAQLLDGDSPRLSVEVVVPSEREREGITMTITGAGDDITRLGRHQFFPREQLSYDIDVDVLALEETLTLDARSLRLGGSTLRGSVLWDYGEKALEAELQVPNADLQAWIPPQEPDDDDTASPVSDDGRRIPDLELPFAWLHDYRIEVSLDTGNLGLPDPQFSGQPLVEQTSLQLSSGDGMGVLSIDRFEGSRGSITGKLKIDDRRESAVLSTSLDISRLPLGIIAASTLYSALPRYEVSSSLEAGGSNLRSIAASLNGEFLMTGGPGHLRKMKLSAATESFIAQVFRTLLPMLAKESTDMEVECAVLAARADKGVLTLDPGLIFRSKEVDLSAYGQVDLKSEKISINFNNRARKGLGISAASVVNPFVGVTGTLARPTLGLDITSSAISGGAAVATAGATIIAKPLLERIFKRGDPCEAALKQWNKNTD